MSADITVSASVVTYNDINRAPATCRSVVEHTKKYPLSDQDCFPVCLRGILFTV